jgi:hypothetical protein
MERHRVVELLRQLDFFYDFTQMLDDLGESLVGGLLRLVSRRSAHERDLGIHRRLLPRHGEERRRGAWPGVGILGVEADEGFCQQSGIFHAAGKHADLIQRPRLLQDPVA